MSEGNIVSEHVGHNPPEGWFAFGTHVDRPGTLEFSKQTDDAGMPLWERPVVVSEHVSLVAQLHEVCVKCGKPRLGHYPDPPDGYWPECRDFDNGDFEVITLCGSTRFKDEFMAENQRLTMEGKVVISLGVFGHTDLPDYDWTTDASDLKRRLDGLHFQKIRMADRVHVIDPGGYVGESTRREINYARALGKPVTYLSTGGDDA